MICIIAEKPSVARDIAKIVGATSGGTQTGCLEGQGYIVTWAFGHLIELAMPSEYDFQNQLPMFPNPFKRRVRTKTVKKAGKFERVTDSDVKKQLDNIKKCFDKSEKIVVATDAGREGELIFRYIYEYLNCRKPFERLWISSLTDKAIKDGLKNLKPGRDYDNLYRSGRCRSEADWIVGLNASTALGIKTQSRNVSLGRVQTPTLALICKRFLENKNFKSIPYYKLFATFEKDGTQTAIGVDHFDTIETAKSKVEKITANGKLTVENVDRKTCKIQPPLLHDLTSLQKEANRKKGMSAERTLQIAQSLYEKKVTTYPRTGSQYISDDVFETIPSLLKKAVQFTAGTAVSSECEKLLAKGKLNRRSVDASKVTDHHALLITGEVPKELREDERFIFEMIMTRMIEAFAEECVKENLNVKFDSEGEKLYFKASRTVAPGWKSILHEQEEKEDDETELDVFPEFKSGEKLNIVKAGYTSHETKPKPIFTEATLLSAMENAGKEVEDEEAAKAMKECGLGTPATRAAIIEKLLTKDYIIRNKKQLIPTEKGLSIYQTVKDYRIANAQMTGEWEKLLAEIESGKYDAEKFDQGIKDYTLQINEQILNSNINLKEKKMEREKLVCPKCKKESVIILDKVAMCTCKDECDFKVFRTICNKTIPEGDMKELLQKGKTKLLKGFKSKAGKDFAAHLFIKEDYNIGFEFENKQKK